MNSKFCSECGASISLHAKRCPTCGESLQKPLQEAKTASGEFQVGSQTYQSQGATSFDSQSTNLTNFPNAASIIERGLKRNSFFAALLSTVTFGIYDFYLLWYWFEELSLVDGKRRNAQSAIVWSILTLGIYWIFTIVRLASDICSVQRKYNLQPEPSLAARMIGPFLISILLSLFGTLSFGVTLLIDLVVSYLYISVYQKENALLMKAFIEHQKVANSQHGICKDFEIFNVSSRSSSSKRERR